MRLKPLSAARTRSSSSSTTGKALLCAATNEPFRGSLLRFTAGILTYRVRGDRRLNAKKNLVLMSTGGQLRESRSKLLV